MKNRQTDIFAAMSLIFITLTVIASSVVHFYDFGFNALIIGAVMIIFTHAIFFLFLHTKKRVFLVSYGLLNLFFIIGFGIFRGFWNHAIKLLLSYMHGGLPPVFSKLFINPVIGSTFYETTGVLIFISSMFAAYFVYKFITDIAKEKNHDNRD
jgi:hypothetical protein